MLTGSEIIRARNGGNIIIEPFHTNQVQANSYDIRIGKWIARFTKFLNPADNKPHVFHSVPPEAMNYEDLFDLYECDNEIVLSPGERILCHTEEFFGSVAMSVPMLATRSTIARFGMDICGSAGFGDIGYINRWTLELQNNSPFIQHIPVGARVGQVYFNEADTFAEIERIVGSGKIDLTLVNWYGGEYRLKTGEYTLENMIEKWHPKMMLPKGVISGWETNLIDRGI